MTHFVKESATEITLRLEATEDVMVAAETKVLGPRFPPGKGDQHMSQSSWTPMDEDDWEPEPRTRIIDINLAKPRGNLAEWLNWFWQIAAECGADGEVSITTQTKSTYGQVFIPPRPMFQNQVRINVSTVAEELSRRISKARDVLYGDGPV